MPSPFPGMDPYLEGDLWSSFHALFVPAIIQELTPRIRPKYIAYAQKYQVIVDAADETEPALASVFPDVGVTRTGEGGSRTQGGAVTAPLVIDSLIPHREPHLMIEIRDIQNRRLVTAIEFLSPTNKIGRGRSQYLRKRNRLLRSNVHLLEIDLIRAGRRVPLAKPLPEDPYFIFLSRAGRRPQTEIWPIRLAQPLPRVPVPLMKGDDDVMLDLQRAFNVAYDTSGFDAGINFAEMPPVNLSDEEAAWLDARLKQAGLRK